MIIEYYIGQNLVCTLTQITCTDVSKDSCCNLLPFCHTKLIFRMSVLRNIIANMVQACE